MPRRSLPVPADVLFEYTPARPRERPSQPSRFQPSSQRHAHRVHRSVVAASATVCVNPESVIPESPDALEWDNVDSLLMPGPAPPCPISLDTLSAPRVTRCGHVMSHVCALQLHHHAAMNGTPAKCPLCSEKMNVDDLRMVDFLPWIPPDVGSVAKLRLVARPRYSVVARPYAKADTVGDFTKLPSQVTPGSCGFSRLVTADVDYLLDRIARAVEDLDRSLREDPSLKPFVDSAKQVWKKERDMLRKRRRSENARQRSEGLGGRTPPVSFMPPGGADGNVPSSETSSLSKKGEASSLGSESRVCPKADMAKRDSGMVVPRREFGKDFPPLHAAAHEQPGMYVFFQGSNGQKLFLLPLCDRIVKAEFASDFSQCKQTVECPIIDLERHTMDEALRKRYGFLRHLPLGCDFSFVEVDLSNVVSEQTLAAFATDLAERQAVRRRRAKKSEREDRLAADVQKKSMQNYFQLPDGFRHPREELNVDSSDIASFPPMPVSSDGDVQGADLNAVSASSPSTSEAVQWGSTVSSYSAATSNMGVFPSLSAVVSSSAPANENGSEGGLSGRPTDPSGSGSSGSVSLPRRVPGAVPQPSNGVQTISPPSRGVWGGSPGTGGLPESPNAVSGSGSSPRRSGGGRRGKKQITLLSTAGPQCNRR